MEKNLEVLTYTKKKDILSEVSNRTIPTLFGGTMLVGVYSIVIPTPEELEGDFIEQELIEPTPQGEIKSEEFQVEDGSPTTEYVFANATTTDYLSQYIFVKKVGIIEIPVTVSKTYNLTWTEYVSGEDGEEDKPVEMKASKKVTDTVTVERPYAYWTIEHVDVYFLKEGIINNQALQGEVS